MRKTEKGLNEAKVKRISKLKGEPKWMTDFRVKAYREFVSQKMPKFGPEIDLNFDNITYYKSMTDKISKKWEDVPENIRNTFDKLGIPDAEKKYLAGVGAQYESGVVYHNMAWLGVRWGIGARELALSLGYSWIESAVMAGVKLVPFGQQAAQQLIITLSDHFAEGLDAALSRSDDELGAATPLSAIASARHETQYSRLFRS